MLLFCLGIFVPALEVVGLVVSPAPLALLGVRENKVLMTMGLLGAALALWLFFGWLLALSYLCGCGMLCFGLTLPLGKLEKGSECLLLCAAASIVSKVAFLAFSAGVAGVSPIDLNALRGTLNGMYAGALGGGGQDAAQLRETLDRAVEMIPYMLPFFIIVYSMFESFVNYKLCEALQRKREGKNELKFPPLPPFGEWRFPASLLYMLAFAFLLPFFTEPGGLTVWVALEYNFKFISNIFFFLQGLALIWWWFAKYAASHRFPLPLRVALIGFLSMPLLNTWVTALGVGDICIDFRTKKMKRA